MSLKRMPGLGKSGTSRMNFLISSMNYSPSVEILDFKAVLFNKESRVLQPQKAAGPRGRRGGGGAGCSGGGAGGGRRRFGGGYLRLLGRGRGSGGGRQPRLHGRIIDLGLFHEDRTL